MSCGGHTRTIRNETENGARICSSKLAFALPIRALVSPNNDPGRWNDCLCAPAAFSVNLSVAPFNVHVCVHAEQALAVAEQHLWMRVTKFRIKRERDNAVSEYDDANCGSEPADPVSTLTRNKTKATKHFVSAAATIGVIAAGTALFEVALIPGIAIGAAAALAPKLRRRLRPLLNSMVRGRIEPASARPNRPDHKAPLVAPAGIAIKQALAKTVTFQIIGTTMDFTAHYVVVGSLGTAASLSAIGFVVSPFVYFGHEMAWDYYRSWTRRLDPMMRKSLVPAPG
jgi:uncharacterized membrane protein